MEWQRPGNHELVRAGLATTTGGIDNRRVEALTRELERGVMPNRPELLKWLCDKLCSLPTQNGTALNGAIWADNVMDVCGHYPEDLLQKATLELLSTKIFRPSPAEIVAVVEPRYAERKRMLGRVKALLGPKSDAPKAFEPEPRTVRLRNMITSYRKHGYVDRAAKFEIELAEVEGRAPEDWVHAAATSTIPMSTEKPSLPTRPPSPQMRAALDMAVAQRHRAQGRAAYADRLERRAVESGYVERDSGEPPPHDDVPEAMEVG